MKKDSPRRAGKSSSRQRPCRTPQEYLAGLDDAKRGALEKLRTAIRGAVSGAEECISYGLPAFRWKGKFLVAYGAAKNHCAFYPGSVVQVIKSELTTYETSKGTIRFPPGRPLPTRLVRKLVKLRKAELTC